MSRKRVVVTGLSALTPLGGNVTESWDNLLAGKSGIGPITLFDASGFDSRIAGEVKGFDPEAYGIPAKQARRMDRFVQFSVAAGNMLVEHSGLVINDDNAGRVSVILGVGLGGLHTIEVFHSRLVEAGPGQGFPLHDPHADLQHGPGPACHRHGGQGREHGAHQRLRFGTHAIGAAYTEIVMGRCDACISGGVEATVTPMGISGFTALKALSTAHNDDPEKASRPFDKDRDGFVMGEGAGLLMLESLEHAQARGATIYAEIIGAGSSDDAFHMTAPRDDGEGMIAAMQRAIADAGVSPTWWTTSTRTPPRPISATSAKPAPSSRSSANAPTRLPSPRPSPRPATCLGPPGGVEAVFSVLALHTGYVPGTINYETPDPECDLNCMTDGAKKLDPQYALSNSFGFGGTNGSILFKKFTA